MANASRKPTLPLVIQDDPAVRILETDLFEDDGFDVLQAWNENAPLLQRSAILAWYC
jgi:hypothetical protein